MFVSAVLEAVIGLACPQGSAGQSKVHFGPVSAWHEATQGCAVSYQEMIVYTRTYSPEETCQRQKDPL